jgi:hypothetical protein
MGSGFRVQRLGGWETGRRWKVELGMRNAEKKEVGKVRGWEGEKLGNPEAEG